MKTYTETEALALRDAAVADAAAVCERMAQGHDRLASAAPPAAEERHKGTAAELRLAADRIRSLAPQEPRDAAVAEEREACARVAEAAAAQHRTREGDDSHDARVARYAADVLRDVAAGIRARAPQEPAQRPEAPRDGATPAPDAPSPAGGLTVAAIGEHVADLLRRAEACDLLAVGYEADAREDDRGDAAVSAARVRGKAHAYRHAAEMLRGAVS